MLVFDVYEEEEFLGSLGVEGGKLIFVGPETDYLKSLVEEYFPDDSAEEVILGFPKKFNGVTHCRTHGNPNVHKPD